MSQPTDTTPDSHDAGDARDLDIGAAALKVCDAIGDLMSFWGFQRSHGRIWALLFLVERPLHAGEIGTALGLSAGQVSMSVRELEHWGVLHPVRQPGQRRTWFRPENNLFRMVARVFRERELEQVKTLARTLQAALAELREQSPDAVARFRIRRLEGLVAATEVGRTVIEWLVEGKLLPKAIAAALDRPIAD